jgi:hypothetical protein
LCDSRTVSASVSSKTGTDLIQAGATTDGHGLLTVRSKTGQTLIGAGVAADDTGFFFEGFNKTVREWFSYLLTTTTTV